MHRRITAAYAFSYHAIIRVLEFNETENGKLGQGGAFSHHPTLLTGLIIHDRLGLRLNNAGGFPLRIMMLFTKRN